MIETLASILYWFAAVVALLGIGIVVTVLVRLYRYDRTHPDDMR